MPDPNASLRALLGGGQNIANSRMALRNQQLQDPRTTAAFEQQVAGENTDEAAMQAADPFSQRYAALQDSQSGGLLYNQPEQQQQRTDVLERQLAPIRLKGQIEADARAAQSAGIEDRFHRSQETIRRGQDLGMSKTGISQQGQTERAQNASLENQAKVAEKSSRGLYGLLAPQWMGGQASPADQAAAIRARQTHTSGTTPTPGAAGGDMREQVAAALQARGFDPSEVDQVMADPEAMQELGF